MSSINKIAVIGAGNMGSGIAQKIAQEGLNVVLVDIKEEFVERGINTIRKMLKEAVERKILSSDQVHDILSRIIGTCDFEMVANADLIIEAVFQFLCSRIRRKDLPPGSLYRAALFLPPG
jgi:enoyl-CoA hydratase/3-hydroxyacyl-CoA dehydrogenase